MSILGLRKRIGYPHFKKIFLNDLFTDQPICKNFWSNKILGRRNDTRIIIFSCSTETLSAKHYFLWIKAFRSSPLTVHYLFRNVRVEKKRFYIPNITSSKVLFSLVSYVSVHNKMKQKKESLYEHLFYAI